MTTISLKAQVANLDEALRFIDQSLESAGFGEKPRGKVMLAAEEIFVNIASYAYPGKEGEVTISFVMESDKARIDFRDQGAPYNPLSREEPDLTASAGERPVGGLGIYLARKMTDAIGYRHEDGQNILTIWKKLQ